jgi:hypothetical protein
MTNARKISREQGNSHVEAFRTNVTSHIRQNFARLADELFRAVEFYKHELEGALNHAGA